MPWETTRTQTWPSVAYTLQFGHGGDAVGDYASPVIRSTSDTGILQFGHGGDAVGDNAAHAIRADG